MYYSGMVQPKNFLNTMLQSFFTACNGALRYRCLRCLRPTQCASAAQCASAPRIQPTLRASTQRSAPPPHTACLRPAQQWSALPVSAPAQQSSKRKCEALLRQTRRVAARLRSDAPSVAYRKKKSGCKPTGIRSDMPRHARRSLRAMDGVWLQHGVHIGRWGLVGQVVSGWKHADRPSRYDGIVGKRDSTKYSRERLLYVPGEEIGGPLYLSPMKPTCCRIIVKTMHAIVPR